MTPNDDERDDPDSSDATAKVDAGYANFQIAKALTTATQHTDPALRARALQRARRWEEVLDKIRSQQVYVGSRTPVAAMPAWATLEVVTGGFATGRLLAGGPLADFERDQAARLGLSDASTARAALNEYYLSEPGLTELYERVVSGYYRVEVPEEAALPTIAWLIAHAEVDSALELVEIIEPHFGRLRFYPAPAQQPVSDGARMHVQDVARGVAALEAVQAQERVLAQKEAVQVWAPYHDRVVALFLDTRVDGWPCRCYPHGWASLAQALLNEYALLRAQYRRCTKYENPRKHYAQLRSFLARCASEPESLSGREVGRIRMILQRYCDKHGKPGAARCQAQRLRQVEEVSAPSLRDVARIVAGRLRAWPQDEGLEHIEPMLHEVTAAEAAGTGVPDGTSIPVPVRRKVERCLSATLDELVTRGLAGSGEVVARLLPQLSAQLRAASLPDLALRRLYAETYRAFRRRRSLLLLNLQSQVRLDELPWAARLDRLRRHDPSDQVAARRALTETVALVLSAFPHAVVPNNLVTELDLLARQAGLAMPLTEEVAADIFMGQFGDKYLLASRRAAALLDGSMYARYYDIDAGAIAALKHDKTSLAKLCAARAGVAFGSGRPALNGRVLEQQQILNVHNLAVLYADLELESRLGGQLNELASRCLRWICVRQQMKIDGRHARLIMIKQTACAWRQLVFFVSQASQARQDEFVAEAHALIATQSVPFRQRFEPVMRGLSLAVNGERLDDGRLQANAALRFLGWTEAPHPLLTNG